MSLPLDAWLTLRDHIQERIPYIAGPWVDKQSNYEPDLAEILEAAVHDGRYWDASWSGVKLEFKKGRSIWLDLVRYAEQMGEITGDAREEVATLFLIPNPERSKIVEVIVCETEKLLDYLNLQTNDAKTLLELRERVPRSLNAQASMTVPDARRISKFIVEA